MQTPNLNLAFDNFNGLRENKVVMFFDEADIKQTGPMEHTMKSAITEDRITIRNLYREARPNVPNYNRFVCGTNSLMAVNLNNGQQRRYVELQMSTVHSGDKPYWDRVYNAVDTNPQHGGDTTRAQQTIAAFGNHLREEWGDLENFSFEIMPAIQQDTLMYQRAPLLGFVDTIADTRAAMLGTLTVGSGDEIVFTATEFVTSFKQYLADHNILKQEFTVHKLFGRLKSDCSGFVKDDSNIADANQFAHAVRGIVRSKGGTGNHTRYTMYRRVVKAWLIANRLTDTPHLEFLD